jgi:hypothetical protein
MPQSKPHRTSSLFSLSARIARREARPTPAAGAHADDGCPICLATRTGGNPMAFFPGLDGSAPALPEAFLINAAREAMAKKKPKADKAVPFIEYGGLIGRSSFSVDGSGRVFWTSTKEHRQVLQLPRPS